MNQNCNKEDYSVNDKPDIFNSKIFHPTKTSHFSRFKVERVWKYSWGTKYHIHNVKIIVFTSLDYMEVYCNILLSKYIFYNCRLSRYRKLIENIQKMLTTLKIVYKNFQVKKTPSKWAVDFNTFNLVVLVCNSFQEWFTDNVSV